MESEKMTAKKFSMNVLNGVAIGTVLALIPGALLGELFKALLPIFPQGQFVLDFTTLSNSLLGLIVGVLIGYQFKFTPIQSASVGLAVMVGEEQLTFQVKPLQCLERAMSSICCSPEPSPLGLFYY